MKKRILPALLALCLLLAVIPVNAAAGSDDFVIEDGVLSAYKGTGKHVVIPEGVTRMDIRVFADTPEIVSVKIPSTVSSIYTFFKFAPNLTEILVDPANPWFSSVDGILFTKDEQGRLNELVACPCAKSGTCTVPEGVKGIGSRGFDSCEKLIAIRLPNSITQLGENAFADCTGLSELVIPDSVTEIEHWAFNNCKSLKQLELPDSVTRLGQGVFSGCAGLSSITIPASVARMGQYQFFRCDSLTEIILDPASKLNVATKDGVLYSYDFKELIAYPPGKEGDFVIPEGVESIFEQAFRWCRKLTGVTLPESLTAIESNVFDGCTGLTTLTIPAGVKTLGYAPFMGCSNLKNIHVDPANGSYCDIDGVLCTKDRKALLAYPCGKGSEYAVPEGITRISLSAFEKCEEIVRILLPKSYSVVGENFPFSTCNNLTSVMIDPENNKFMERDHMVLTKDGKEFVFSPLGQEGDLVIPYGITKVWPNAVGKPERFASITIPDTVTRIEFWAFDTGLPLENVYYTGSQEDWEKIDFVNDKDALKKSEIHFNAPMPTPVPTASPIPTATPSPVPTATPAPVGGFTDVKENDWFASEVRYVVENGMMEGVGNRFLPNKTTTRAELVTILYRLEGKPDSTGDSTFTDVKTGNWFTPQVQWAAEKGIVRGYADGSFKPNREITRQEFAAILYRYADYKNYDVNRGQTLDAFPDKDQVDSYAQVPLQWAVDAGLITGSGGRLNPKGKAVRAQTATILHRMQSGDIVNAP